MKTDYMKISSLNPDLKFRVVNTLEEFREDNSGFLTIWNGSSKKINNITEHTAFLASLGDYVPVKTNSGMIFENQFFPKNTPYPALKNGWKNDTTKVSHTTGGGRRFYVFPPLRNYYQKDDQNAYNALLTWNLDQLNRPMSHYSWNWVWDSYSGVLNKGTPDEWNYDKSASNGWNGWDPAHLETSPQFSLAVTGHPLGLMNLWLLWRFVVSCVKPGKTFWMNQPRSTAWTLIMAVRAHYAGFGDGDASALSYCQGYTPAAALNAWVKQLLEADVNGGYSYGGGNAKDNRVMPVLPPADWNGYGKQVKAEYGWQRGILLWSCAYVLKSGILTPDNQVAFQAFSDRLYETQLTRGFDSAKGLSYAYGTTDIKDQLTADQLKTEAEAQSIKDGNPLTLEIHEATSGNWVVRHIPRNSDFWLTAAASAVLKGKNDVMVQTSLIVNPKPNTKNYQYEYQDVIYASLEV